MKPKETTEHYILSSSPHTHAAVSVRGLMLDVIIALLPTTIAGICIFGRSALWTVLTCVSAALVTEALCRLAMRRESTVGDLSAILTGLLLALNLPAGIPLWMAALGSVFAIAVAKQVFGGLGMNPFNPALAARAFLLVSFAGPMTTWLVPRCPFGLCSAATPLTQASPTIVESGVEVLTTATPLVAIKTGEFTTLPSLCELFVGHMPGTIGEVSAVALLIGAAYLLLRRVITWHIPFAFLATVAAYALISRRAPVSVELLTGGVILSAFFMATDYVTSPTTSKGKLVFGCGCGLLTMLVRQFGAYPEGCSFAILIMNAVTPLINRWTQPKPFGAK